MKIKDLTGNRFGMLIAIKVLDSRSLNGKVMWECICDCGNVVNIRSHSLQNGDTKSCGCYRIKDLTGQRFGKLTVVSLSDKRTSNDEILWLCKCDCGNETITRSGSLTNNHTKSCGCLKMEQIVNLGKSNITDLTGQIFGRLTVLSENGRTKHGYVSWNCKCDCGNITNVRSASLQSGGTRSCGCLQIETCRELGNVTTHGLTGSPEYAIWAGMVQRCTNPNSTYYCYYGGRGITVCDRWLNSFTDWFAYLGPRPSPEYSLDRFPDNDGNYEPGNCRWATQEEQQNNRRDNVMVTYKGKQYSATLLAREHNIIPNTFMSRLRKGWTVEDAVEIPVKYKVVT